MIKYITSKPGEIQTIDVLESRGKIGVMKIKAHFLALSPPHNRSLSLPLEIGNYKPFTLAVYICTEHPHEAANMASARLRTRMEGGKFYRVGWNAKLRSQT